VRIPISSAYREGEVYALGKLESGRLSRGDELILVPSAVPVTVTQILIADTPVETAESGDMVRLKVSLPRSSGDEDIPAGACLCSPLPPPQPVTRFQVCPYLSLSPSLSLPFSHSVLPFPCLSLSHSGQCIRQPFARPLASCLRALTIQRARAHAANILNSNRRP